MFMIDEVKYLNEVVNRYMNECEGMNEMEIEEYLDGRLEGDLEGFGVNCVSDSRGDREYERVCSKGYEYVRERLIEV